MKIKQNVTPAILARTFDDYYHEAIRLREKYAGQIQLLVGMEVDWIRPSSLHFINGLQQKYHFDLFIGSVHHVNGIPTDYDRELYLKAREKSEGTCAGDEKIFEAYFDLQLEMLENLKPPIVGHFDVIRLWSDDKDASFARYPEVWRKITRNLDVIVGYGGVLEINSAALRKGMKEPYPMAEICQVCLPYYFGMFCWLCHLHLVVQEFRARGGLFTLSDDSHGIAQIATHYAQTFAFLEESGIEDVVCFENSVQNSTLQDRQRRQVLTTRTVKLPALKAHPFLP